MENLESCQHKPEYLEASKNWEEKGYLGVTAEDHEAINSTPDEILLQNPGKTLGELMSDQDIRNYIIGTRKNIIENNKLPHLKKYNEDLQQNLNLTIEYLESLGRLPKDLP